MDKIALRMIAAFMLVLVGVALSYDAKAADADMPRARVSRTAAIKSSCPTVWQCGPVGCFWRNVCVPPTRCPDRYSCYPLYGAYPPFGGFVYGSAYSYGGWSHGGWGYRP